MVGIKCSPIFARKKIMDHYFLSVGAEPIYKEKSVLIEEFIPKEPVVEDLKVLPGLVYKDCLVVYDQETKEFHVYQDFHWASFSCPQLSSFSTINLGFEPLSKRYPFYKEESKEKGTKSFTYTPDKKESKPINPFFLDELAHFNFNNKRGATIFKFIPIEEESSTPVYWVKKDFTPEIEVCHPSFGDGQLSFVIKLNGEDNETLYLRAGNEVVKYPFGTYLNLRDFKDDGCKIHVHKKTKESINLSEWIPICEAVPFKKEDISREELEQEVEKLISPFVGTPPPPLGFDIFDIDRLRETLDEWLSSAPKELELRDRFWVKSCQCPDKRLYMEQYEGKRDPFIHTTDVGEEVLLIPDGDNYFYLYFDFKHEQRFEEKRDGTMVDKDCHPFFKLSPTLMEYCGEHLEKFKSSRLKRLLSDDYIAVWNDSEFDVYPKSLTWNKSDYMPAAWIPNQDWVTNIYKRKK